MRVPYEKLFTRSEASGWDFQDTPSHLDMFLPPWLVFQSCLAHPQIDLPLKPNSDDVIPHPSASENSFLFNLKSDLLLMDLYPWLINTKLFTFLF